MAPSKIFRLFTVLSLAILNVSFDALPANALAVEPGHMARGVNHAHAGIAKKRSSSKHCKPRPIPNASASISSTLSTSSHHSNAAAHLATPTSTPSSQLSTPKTTTTTTTSHSSTPSVAASSSGSCGNRKVGLAWSNHEQDSLHNFITPCTHYISNWQVEKYDSSVTGEAGYSQLEFVPTVHDRDQIPKISLLTRGYASIVKGWNEPEIATQSNMSPQDGCSLWQEHMDPLTQLGYELVAPSVTTSPKGLQWLQQFMSLCKGSKIRNIDIHHYSVNADQLITAVNQFHDTFGMNIWVGEIGCVDYSGQNQPCTQDVFNTFFSKAVSFMESTSYVETYSWFGLFTAAELPNGVPPVNSMITCGSDLSNCKPNALGNQYLNP